MIIRDERQYDREAIRRVVADAFGGVLEADLVDDLRRGGDLVVSLVAEADGRICGHAALSRLKSPHNAVALAPVSVLASMQGRGTGSTLVQQAIARARGLGTDI